MRNESTRNEPRRVTDEERQLIRHATDTAIWAVKCGVVTVRENPRIVVSATPGDIAAFVAGQLELKKGPERWMIDVAVGSMLQLLLRRRHEGLSAKNFFDLPELITLLMLTEQGWVFNFTEERPPTGEKYQIVLFDGAVAALGR